MTIPAHLAKPALPLTRLGNHTIAEFMRTYWQREPLLIRQAFPQLKPPLAAAQLRRLAEQDDVESRLVQRSHGQWQLDHGPFTRLPQEAQRDWILLVQSVDLHDDATAALMHRFRFVPDARLDDIMMSLAGPGGGVGAHFDSYDVFLLQAAGRKRWRYGQQKNLELEADLPLKILKHFEPEEECVLEPGDMLYLPPHVAHDGIAERAGCMTISIGFRAPTHAELAQGLFDATIEALPEGLHLPELEQRYSDVGIAPTPTPALLPDSLIDATLQAVQRIPITRTLAINFLGRRFTEPSPYAVFDYVDDDDGIDLTADWPVDGCIVLDRRTRFLYYDTVGFINGEPIAGSMSAQLRRLADTRRLPCNDSPPSEPDRLLLEDWRRAGWVHYCSD